MISTQYTNVIRMKKEKRRQGSNIWTCRECRNRSDIKNGTFPPVHDHRRVTRAGSYDQAESKQRHARRVTFPEVTNVRPISSRPLCKAGTVICQGLPSAKLFQKFLRSNASDFQKNFKPLTDPVPRFQYAFREICKLPEVLSLCDRLQPLARGAPLRSPGTTKQQRRQYEQEKTAPARCPSDRG